MKISGTERALPNEKIILNISIMKESISKVILYLSDSLSLKFSYNYDLDKKFFSKKKIIFEVSKFKFENNLTLGFISEQLEDSEKYAHIKIEALDIKENVKEMSIFDIEIIKPEIEIEIEQGEIQDQLFIKLEKKNNEITAFFEGLDLSAVDYYSEDPVKIKVIHFSEEEYVENLDKIPIIFDIDTAIKEIIIFSNNKVKLKISARYRDILGNKYESNKASIILKPPGTEIEKEEFITNPIFNAVGFEMSLAADAST
ncbi:MAG: hypothetical protein ACTSRH_07790 [Promethearchaeota archaeon]